MSIFYINKANLINNVKLIKSKLSNDVLLCSMVKANAYSHDAVIVSNIIEKHVDYFGVATVEEGLTLRKSGIKKPILCVGGILSVNEYNICSKYNIDVTIHDINSLNIALKSKHMLNAHLKIDTGMSRLGFKNYNEFLKAYNTIKKSDNLKLRGVFSHFIQSEEKSKYTTDKQFENFLQYCANLDDKKIILHISNSSAIKNQKYNLNMVRCGLALYGYGNLKGLKRVLKIKAKVIAVHTIKKGESVGYNATYKAKKDEIIATVAFGYSDGMDMRYTGSFVKIYHKKYKIVGKICMDMFMIRADKTVKVGDDVIILDNANYLAMYSKKSVYEVISDFKNTRAKIIVE